MLSKMNVTLLDRNVRFSRMLNPATIYLCYDNFDEQQEDIEQVFNLLHQYESGQGRVGTTPVLLGFEKKGSKIVNLEAKIEKQFPQFSYVYDGKKQILKVQTLNPEILYDISQD